MSVNESSGTPTPESRFAKTLAELQEVANTLAKISARLEQRLKPVLDPESKETSGDSAPNPTATPLIGSMQEVILDLRATSRALIDIEVRLCL